MKRPSIVFINRVYPPSRGASGRVLRDLARSFAREGWQVSVITTGEKAVRERDGAVRVIRVKGKQTPSALGYVWILLKLFVTALRLPKAHVVVSMTDPPLLAVAGQIVSLIKGNRHIHWCQDVYPDLFPALGVSMPAPLLGPMRALSLWAMKAADKVIVIGRCMARNLSQDGFDPKQITVIPNWPDSELGQSKTKESAPALFEIEGMRKPEEQIQQDPKFRVLYAGNIGLAHPVETIVKAAEILAVEHPEIDFVFVGEGRGYDKLAQERQKRHLENIRLLPFQPANRLAELMESGDVHVISMKHEAAGMLVPSKLYAAIAAYRPCVMVGPAQSEAAKVIKSFSAGSVVRQGQAKKLAEEIRQYRMDRDKWMRAYEGAQEAAKVFVPKDAIDAWIDRAWSVVEPDMDID